ncbi:MAG TPA: zf-HC2 domain-containing protein [Symbiobacteriaceae bacterium]|nr:zf-HC2 domain-containing protein [Symbiobacteriaceae bacterium]
MKQCPVIQDLLPLYVDDALSRESWVLVDEHLADCADCRQALAAMRDGGPSVATPIDLSASEEVRWLSRLKRRVGTIVGVVILLLVAAPSVPLMYLGWRGEREKDRAEQAYMQVEKRAIETILATTPDPLARLRARGVSVTSVAAYDGHRLAVNYTMSVTSPAEAVYTFNYPPVSGARLIDPTDGKLIGRSRESEGQITPGSPTAGKAVFDDVPALPAGAKFQLPFLMVYLKPDQNLKWDVHRPSRESEVPIGQRFTTAGVEFEIVRIRFTEYDAAEIDYRQLTSASQVGVHLLSFRLSDGMGGTWGDEPLPNQFPDLMQPNQHFNLVTSPSKNFVIELQHAVLALPGPVIPLEMR